MNKIIIIGRWTKDPELKFTPGNGTAVVQGTLAVDRRFKKEGQPGADFIPVVIWGKQAEATANYSSKGKLIAISGRIQTRTYDAKDGTKRYVTEVVAEEVQFLEWANSGQASKSSNNFDEYDQDMTQVADDGDIPF
ncbi:single-stranded DNA-binding protein [Clostridium algidicarnis]|uniref:single-stranded DNA-binding protein n=1 Tax=Clostridium algidicarnis TaxID=37659 RepID=UPI001C0D1EDB|nr:single-stranded DNA-binding protein [Clostridium algidicarnis]MBU3195682.1 single-stranded DNA-binding protein [Clostridium algidicarnis]